MTALAAASHPHPLPPGAGEGIAKAIFGYIYAGGWLQVRGAVAATTTLQDNTAAIEAEQAGVLNWISVMHFTIGSDDLQQNARIRPLFLNIVALLYQLNISSKLKKYIGSFRTRKQLS